MSKIELTEEQKQLQKHKNWFIETLHELEEKTDEIFGDGSDEKIEVKISIESGYIKYSIWRERHSAPIRRLLQEIYDEQPKKHN